MPTDPTLPARLQACIDNLSKVSAQAFFVNRALGPGALAPPAIWRGRSARRHHSEVARVQVNVTGATSTIEDLIELLENKKTEVVAQLAREAEARRQAEAAQRQQQQPAAPWQPWQPWRPS